MPAGKGVKTISQTPEERKAYHNMASYGVTRTIVEHELIMKDDPDRLSIDFLVTKIFKRKTAAILG